MIASSSYDLRKGKLGYLRDFDYIQKWNERDIPCTSEEEIREWGVKNIEWQNFVFLGLILIMILS